ncbi:TonB-dependent receptor, partial [Hydrogenophaga sp. A37]|uniref:TonB-dependent siderophore receptor n=1 Tax=Hydrogenophaga sp. A37 TaxID=1945864 RepID=UPI00098696B4
LVGPRHGCHPRPSTLALALQGALLTLAVGSAMLPQVAHAQSAPTALPTGGEVVAFNVPAGPLAAALDRFARTAKVNLSYDAALLEGQTSGGLSGSHTIAAGLSALLVNSGLEALAQPGGGYSLRQAAVAATSVTSVTNPPAAMRPRPEATLPTVTVTATAAPSSPLVYLSKHAATGALGHKSVLDTPFSVTVVGSEEIAERGAKSVGQIFVNDASVYTPTSSSTTDWWGTQIRGLPVRNSYIDDIPMLLYWGGDFPTEVVDSVTALKGLSGFMYGFGEPGGALSYQLKRPKPDNETTVELGYRNPSLLSAHVDVSRQLGNELAVRANVATEQGTAYNESRIHRTVAALALDKQFGASVKWFTTLLQEDSKNTAEPLQFYLSDYDVLGSGGKLPAVTYRYGDFNVDNAYYRTKTLLASTGLKWKIDDQWDLTYQLGFSRKDHQSNKAFADLLNQQGDYTGYAYNFAGRLDTAFTQAMLQGKLNTGAVKHEVVAGLGLQRSKDAWGGEWYWSNDFNGNIHQPQTFRTTRTPDFTLTPVSADNRQLYAFASDTLHINDQWQAIAGLRFTDYKLKDLDGDPTVDSAYATRKTSPTLALIYKPNALTSVYGSYVEGLEPGQRVDALYANAGEVLGATVSKQHEIGVKHASGGVDYAAALFRIEKANQMDVLRSGARYLTQDGLVTYQGLELSAAHQFTKHLNLGLSGIYLEGAINRVSADNAAVEGNDPAYAPEWQFVVHAQYQVPGVKGLKLHGNARYFGQSYTSEANNLTVPDRTVVGVGFTHDLKMGGHDWTLIGNVYNLFNAKYWAGGGWSSGNAGEARNVSLALRSQF